MIFVDTGAWYALFVPRDPDHARASAWIADNREPLVTTDYVVDELLTLFKRRRQAGYVHTAGHAIFGGAVGRIEWVTPADVDAAWGTFQTFADKDWSFTDCVSRVVMDRLGIHTAFAFDDHFRQFGTVTVVP